MIPNELVHPVQRAIMPIKNIYNQLTTTPQRSGLEPASLEKILTSLFGSKDNIPMSLA